jgi:hypothetical protein
VSKTTDAIEDAKVAGSFIKTVGPTIFTILLTVLCLTLTVLFLNERNNAIKYVNVGADRWTATDHENFMMSDFIPLRNSVKAYIAFGVDTNSEIQEQLVRMEERLVAIDRRLIRIEDKQDGKTR